MIILERGNRHISGVFQDGDAFKRYLAEIDPSQLNGHTIVSMNLTYPLYIFEDRENPDGFTYSSNKEDMNDIIRKYKVENHFNLLVSVVEKDWFPERHSGGITGKDMMGYLNHTHIAKCGNCQKYAPGMRPFDGAFTKEELKDLCDCADATW